VTVRAAFEMQSVACAALGSPFTARLMSLCGARLAPGTAVADRVLDWPGDPSLHADNAPLRLAGALHALKLQGLALEAVYPPADVPDEMLWQAVEAALAEHEARILAWLESPPQTNEVRRSAAILPALAVVEARFGRPVALLELGASGGLNLRADRFRVELPGGGLGPNGAGVRLQPEWRGPMPPLSLPEVRVRAGVDLTPLDPSRAENRLRLLAYLWADQTDRIARTETAIAVAAQVPARLDAGDAGAWLEAELARPAEGLGRVVFHTIAWQYFPPATRARAEAALARAGAEAAAETPLARIALETDGRGSGEGARLSLTLWPDGGTVELGRADFHGRWVAWRGV